MEDLDYCSLVPYWDVFFEKIKTNIMLVFNDSEAKADFLEFDTRELRAYMMHNLDRVFAKSESKNDGDMPSCVVPCNIVGENGEACSYVAQSQNFKLLNEEQKKSIADQILGLDPEESLTNGLAHLLIDRSKNGPFSDGLKTFLQEIKLEQAILTETPRESPDETSQAPNSSPSPNPTPSTNILSRLFNCFCPIKR